MKIAFPKYQIIKNLFHPYICTPCGKDPVLSTFQWNDKAAAAPRFSYIKVSRLNDWEYGVVESFANSSQFDRLRTWSGASIFALAVDGTGFHGQKDHIWQTGSGNLYLSMAIPCSLPVSVTEKLQILPAQILVSLIQPKLKPCFRCEIKQPNDVVITDGTNTYKIAGILTEMRVSSTLITQVRYGLGLNLVHAPEHLEDAEFPAISLRDVSSDFSKTLPIRYLQLSHQFRSILHDILAQIPERLHALSSENSQK